MKIRLILIAICIATSVFAQDKSVSTKTIHAIKRSVLPIVCGTVEQPDNTLKIKKVMGSAFFLNRDGYFLTAGHVLIEWGKISTPDSPCAAFIYVPLGEWKPGISDIQVRWFSFTECIINAKVDVAACKPIQNPFSDPEVGKQVQPLKLTKFFGLPDGTPVAFTGFPLDSLRPVTSKGNIAAYVSDRNEFMVDKASWPGISGCPVYLKNGKVIGIMREAGINLGAGMAFARPSEDIIAFLSANKINTEK